MRVVQQLTGQDWKAVRAQLRQLPQPVQIQVSHRTAEDCQRQLEALGAQVTLVLSRDRDA